MEKEWVALGHRFAERSGLGQVRAALVRADGWEGTRVLPAGQVRARGRAALSRSAALGLGRVGLQRGARVQRDFIKNSHVSPIFLQWLDCVWQMLKQVWAPYRLTPYCAQQRHAACNMDVLRPR